jgi:hypothetical protein
MTTVMVLLTSDSPHTVSISSGSIGAAGVWATRSAARLRSGRSEGELTVALEVNGISDGERRRL